MAPIDQRDARDVAAALAAWCESRPSIAAARVVGAEHATVGYSSETVFVDVAVNEVGADDERIESLVVRLAPPSHGTFRDYDLASQLDAQRAAEVAGVPIASAQLVSDSRWLDTPFMVMPKIDGNIVGEVAIADAWLTSLAVADRTVVHRRFVEALASIHGADAGRTSSVPRRDNPAELDYWDDYLAWSSDGSPVAALVAALDWCRAAMPGSESPGVLLWGDVRLGNVIFGDDRAPRAILDWDMTSIGAPEHDVAWLIALEGVTATFMGRRLEGFPDREGTIAAYESASGRRLRDMDWYEIFALTRSTAIMTRISYLRRAAGLPLTMPIDDNPLLGVIAQRIAAADRTGS